jgi:hypothetical protein
MDRAIVYGFLYGFSLRTWNTVYSFVRFDHCAGVASAPTTDYSLALSLYADLPVVLTIVHFDGTSILSLHSSFILHRDFRQVTLVIFMIAIEIQAPVPVLRSTCPVVP